MTTEIRQLRDDELAQFVRIARAAYGGFRNGELLGVMRYFDFMVSFHGIMLPVGGVGSTTRRDQMRGSARAWRICRR